MRRVWSFVGHHRLGATLVGIAGVAGVAFVLVYFEPQALFIETTVNEALPSVAPDRVTLASGKFRGLEHDSSGRALVVELEDGTRILRFEELNTSNGPDLVVYLSSAPAGGSPAAFDDDYVDLGELKGNLGNQNYEIPANADLSKYRSAVIWCRRFGVGFAVADLRPA